MGLLRLEMLHWTLLDLILIVVFEGGVWNTLSPKMNVKRDVKSPLQMLDPFVVHGLLCVGGHLRNISWPESRNPSFMLSAYTITDSIFQYYQRIRDVATRAIATTRKRLWLLLLRENLTGLSNTGSNERHSTRYKEENYLVQVFWRRLSKDYVSVVMFI